MHRHLDEIFSYRVSIAAVQSMAIYVQYVCVCVSLLWTDVTP